MGSTIQPHNLKAAAVWSRGGLAYDQISRGIADAIEHTVLRLQPQAGERILDLSTGTGWTSRAVARHGAIVTGADIAEDLLDAARARAEAERLDIDYRVGDAEALPFADETFDAVISTFGVMFASRPEAAAAELARVIAPGGRLALSTWTPDGSVFGMFSVMRRFTPAPATAGATSPFDWGRVERLVHLLGRHFDLRIEGGTSFYREPGPAAAWETFSTGYGPTRALAEALTPASREALRTAFIDFHADFSTPLGICVPRDYLVTVGVRRESTVV